MNLTNFYTSKKKSQAKSKTAKATDPKAKKAKAKTTKIKSSKPKKPNRFKGLVLIAKIKDKYLLKSKTPEKSRTYAVYQDDSTKEVRAIQTTSLYNLDKNKDKKVKKGLLLKLKLHGSETPSGIHNTYLASDVEGKKINLENSNVTKIEDIPVNYIKGKKIISFAKKRREVKPVVGKKTS